jgi:hypothetical protein
VRTRVVLLPLALAAVAAAGLLALGGDEPERLATRSPGDPFAVVVDGSRVTGTGRVVAVPGRPVRFCAPVGRADIGYPDGQEPPPQYCEHGVDLTGVDLAALVDRREAAGAVEGLAQLTGTYEGGVLTVGEQAPPQPSESRHTPDVPPCEPPDGGWPRDPRLLVPVGSPDEGDVNLMAEQPALDRYRAEHPEDVVTVALLRPSPDSVLLGVAASDAAAARRAEQALRPAYGERLCVVVSRYSRAQVTAAQAMVDVASPEGARLGVFGGAGEGVGEDLQVEVGYDVVMTTEELAGRAGQHPDGLVVLRPWLTPAAP